jgi:hypothetical protein
MLNEIEVGRDLSVSTKYSQIRERCSAGLEDVLKGILRDAKHSVIPPNPRATRGG